MISRPGLDAIVFDAGGTLIRLDFEWMAEDLGRHGIEVTPAEVRRAEIAGRRAYDASAVSAADPVHAGTAITRGSIDAYFRGTLRALGVPDDRLAPTIARYRERERVSGMWARPMEGAREAIDALGAMGYRMAVVSNSDGRAEHHLVKHSMRAGVEFVVDSQVVGVEKPDPRIFGLAIGRLGTEPARTLYVGDIRSVDEVGARRAGMPFVLLDPYRDYAAPEAARIDGMHQLADWVAATFERPRGRDAAETR